MMIGICGDILGGRLLRDHIGLIHVLRNLDLKLLMVSRARWSGVQSGCGGRAHKEIIESKNFKIYLINFSC